MPDTATTLDHTTNTDLRNNLRSAISRLNQQQTRLQSLEEAKDRAHQQIFIAERQRSDAESALAEAERDEPSRLANSFINGTRIADGGPVARHREQVASAQSEVDKLNAVEEALATEIEKVESSLQSLRVAHLTALSEFVVSSPEYHSLLAAHSSAWTHLRTIRTALRSVASGLHGYLPQHFYNQAERTEPLEERFEFPVDKEFVQAWASAMSALDEDADVELPQL